MTKTALENFHGNENVKKLKLDNDKEEAAKGQDHRDVSGIDSIKFEQISKNLELSHEELGQRDGHGKVGLLNGPTENAEDGSQFGGVRSAADMVVVESELVMVDSELVMVESELVARSDISSEEYVPLSAKPLLKIGFEANKKYEEIYLAIQNEKKISKNQSKEEKRNSVKFDKREPGLVKRIPKKKVALLLSYCGTGYNGMQINPNVASIELDLHKALAESGAVLQENAMNPTKNQFMRCARTDKGVHAGGQVVSLKMMIFPNVIEKINACLPDQIRAWGIAKVKNSFDAKDACSSRIYEYLLPTHCLDTSRLQRQGDMEPGPLTGLMGQAIHHVNIPAPSEQEIKQNNEFRIDSETLDQFKTVLKCYEGTHNFHNFTVGKDFNDNSCKRYIISIEVSDPFIPLESKDEWVSIKIHGQSFMLHQIRKMIGLVILMIRSKTPSDLITNSFEKDRINIPKAPALGLLLEKPLFDQYNRQIKAVKEKDENLERDLIDFSLYDKEITEFKQKWIYNAISREENELSVFGMWLAVIDACWSDYSWYLTQDGSLDLSKKPEELFKKGVQLKERADVILAAAGNENDPQED